MYKTISNDESSVIKINPFSLNESKEGNLGKTLQKLCKIRNDYSISITDYKENE